MPNTYYVNPRNADRTSSEMWIGLTYFTDLPIGGTVIQTIRSLAFFAGLYLFGIIAIQMMQYQFDLFRYATDNIAIVVDCEMVYGRSTYPSYQYLYDVEGVLYRGEWNRQLSGDDCTEIAMGTQIDIYYFSNDPDYSTEGTRRFAVYFPVLIPLSVLMLYFSFGFGKEATLSLVGIGQQLWAWRTQQSHRTGAVIGKIVDVRDAWYRSYPTVSYEFTGLDGEKMKGKVDVPRSRSNKPKVGMRVVVLYYDGDPARIA